MNLIVTLDGITTVWGIHCLEAFKFSVQNDGAIHVVNVVFIVNISLFGQLLLALEVKSGDHKVSLGCTL